MAFKYSKWTGECEFAKIPHFPGQPSVYYICLLLHLSATSLKAWSVAARKSRTWFEKNHEDHPRGVARETLLHLRINARTQGQVGLTKYQPYQSWSCGRLDKRQRFGQTARAFICAKKSSCRCLEVIPLWYSHTHSCLYHSMWRCRWTLQKLNVEGFHSQLFVSIFSLLMDRILLSSLLHATLWKKVLLSLRKRSAAVYFFYIGCSICWTLPKFSLLLRLPC